jgi:hypothetical protein
MTQTCSEILVEVNRHRPLCLRHLKRLIKKLGIQPLGARQNPQRYPGDTALRIKTYLGFADDPKREQRTYIGTESRIFSMPEIKGKAGR